MQGADGELVRILVNAGAITLALIRRQLHGGAAACVFTALEARTRGRPDAIEALVDRTGSPAMLAYDTRIDDAIDADRSLRRGSAPDQQ